jgi:hypothetical protein
MQEPIADAAASTSSPKTAPLGDELIGRDEKAALFVASRDELKEEMRRALFEWQITELIDDRSVALALRRKRACPRAGRQARRGRVRRGAQWR